VADLDTTYAYFFHIDIPLSTSSSPSSTHPTHGRMDDLADATTPCLHARVWFPLSELASGITLLRGVGKKSDVRSRLVVYTISRKNTIYTVDGVFL
jgi:hypothetical protein